MNYFTFNTKYNFSKKFLDELKSILLKEFKDLQQFHFHPPYFSENCFVIEFESVGYDDKLRLLLLNIADSLEIRIDNFHTFYKVTINDY